jgi:hemolysin activation/secretion protein
VGTFFVPTLMGRKPRGHKNVPTLRCFIEMPMTEMNDRKYYPMKHQKRSLALNAHFLALPLLLAGAPVFAAPPDAGRMLEEVRPAPALPPSAVPATRIEEQTPISLPDGVRITVKGLRISGQTAFSEAELLALVKDAVGKELSLAELNQLAARITGHYRKRGYLVARAYLPAQDIRDGQVEIAILEGRLGKVEINNSAALADSALAPVSALATDKPLRKNELEGSLLSLADIPGVEVKSTLKPGESIGTSDLLVEVAPGKAVTGALDFDTYGNRYTGDYRYGGSVYFNNPLNRGDQVSLRAQTSGNGLAYGLAGYQLPVGSHGTRIGAAWSEMRYKLGKDFSALDASGDAGVGSVHVLHPFVRSRVLNLYGQVRFETKKLVDRVGITATQTSKTLDNWTVGFNGDRTDAFGGGGTNSFALSYTSGKLGLDATSQAIDAATAQSNGRFGKTGLSFQRLQKLTDATSFYFSCTGQWADKNLDSAEKFTLGGAYGVRAYPQGEATGDEGQLVTAELRWRANDSWQLAGFYDDGQVTINRNPWVAGNNARHLSGAGVGATFNSGKVSVNLLAAWRVGTGSPTSDVDRTPRAWLQAVRYF